LRSLRQLKVDYLGFALVGVAVTCIVLLTTWVAPSKRGAPRR
jgi:hypothetical protein